MSRVLSYLAVTSLVAASTIAACGGGGGSDTSDDGNAGGAANGTGGGFNFGTGSTTGGGAASGIIHVQPPNGFKYDDGTGAKAHKGSGVTDEEVQSFAAALASLPATDPTLAIDYPFTGTMVPPNLNVIDFQWHGVTTAETTFLIRATVGDVNYHVYTKANCSGNGYCDVMLPREEWRTLGYEQPGKELSFEVFASDGTTVRRSSATKFSFSPESIVGALYYWASISRTIKRASFGAEAAVDFIIPGTDTASNGCVGCHSVSRDGTTIAFAMGPAAEKGENVTGIQTAPTTDPTTPYSTPTYGAAGYIYGPPAEPDNQATANQGHNVALNPDGSKMAVNSTDAPENWMSHLDIRDPKSGTTLFSYEVGAPVFGTDKIGIHPEFSPDGSQLAVTLAKNVAGENLSAWATKTGTIATLPVNADGSLGNAKLIVAEPTDGSFNYYPTWSPDSKYIAFVSSWDKGQGSLSNHNGVIRMVAVADAPVTCPSAKCLELTNGTGYDVADAKTLSGNTGSTWPKFAPFAQGDGSIYFITFTSRRKYGSFPVKGLQLWMFGIDSKKAGDPSFVPFWLPYQETTDGSLSPYWTETIPCDTTGDVCTGCASTESCFVDELDGSCTCGSTPVAK